MIERPGLMGALGYQGLFIPGASSFDILGSVVLLCLINYLVAFLDIQCTQQKKTLPY